MSELAKRLRERCECWHKNDGHCIFCHAAEELEAAAALSGEGMVRLIPVSERKPPYSVPVLVMRIGKLLEGEDGYFDKWVPEDHCDGDSEVWEHITHWMPLPPAQVGGRETL
jgi:hypothetical protein